MIELNYLQYVQIYDCRGYSFRLRLDTSGFGKYTRQGVVENIKVPMPIAFKSLAESKLNPAASTPFGVLEPIDMNYFGMGRSE